MCRIIYLLLCIIAVLSVSILFTGCKEDEETGTQQPGINYPPEIQVESPDGTVYGIIVFPITVFDVNGDNVTFTASYSTDGGCTYSEATLVGTPTTVKGSASGTPALIHWNSVADGVGLIEPCTEAKLRIDGTDEEESCVAFTWNFTVDNTQPNNPPAVSVATPSSPQSGTVGIVFTLTDDESDPAYVEMEFSIDGGSTFLPIDATDGYAVPGWFETSQGGTEHSVQWDTIASQVAFFSPEQVVVKIIPRDVQLGQAGQTGQFTVDNTSLVTVPGVSVITPEGEQSGNVEINYTLYDDGSDLINISVEFSTDGGAGFATAMGENKTNLASSPEGENHVFVWNSVADGVGTVQIETDVVIRITPSDSVATGPSAQTGVFTVNNGGFDISAITMNVDSSYAGSVVDGTTEHPYRTIQAAVDAAPAGWRVKVAPGVYNESVILKDGVDMVGCPEDPLSVIVVDQGDPLHKLGAFRSDENGKINADIIGFTLTGLEGKG